MTVLDPKIVKILDDFSKSQPALRLPGLQVDAQNPLLGSMFEHLFLNAKRTVIALWDYSVQGGAVGTIDLHIVVPANSVITAAFADEQSSVAGATSVKLTAGALDVTQPFDLTGVATGPMDLTLFGASPVKTLVDSELKLVISGVPATTGKVRFAVEYYTSEV